MIFTHIKLYINAVRLKKLFRFLLLTFLDIRPVEELQEEDGESDIDKEGKIEIGHALLASENDCEFLRQNMNS